MDGFTLALLVVVGGILLIAVATVLGGRLGVAGPLLLVAIGLGISLLPFVHIPPIPPEWILTGVLPPLLYGAAVSLPAVEFRRDFSPIAGLSVVLVVISALVLGAFFWLVVPGVTLPVGVALGAILSPTDAVATSIAKKLGISGRVITMLEGESLLNDATALVLLRTAVAAIAGGFSLAGAVGSFVWSVVAAVAIGAAAGWLTLRLRAWMGPSAATTAVSFIVPFIAYIPTEQLGGSGLVAAVAAGIVAGQGAGRRLDAEQRLSDTLNWHTVELVLESAVFLVMGLELRSILADNITARGGLWHGVWLALVALAILLAVRAAYVTLLLWGRHRRGRRFDRDRLESFGRRLDAVVAGDADPPTRPPADPERARRRASSLRDRVDRALAGIDYHRATPLGWKHGTVIVWAGMRGVVTLAAAQTLPREGIADRALLIFVAFVVALASLMLQGVSLPTVVRRLHLDDSGAETESAQQRERLDAALRDAAASALADPTLRRADGSVFRPGLTERTVQWLSAPRDADGSAEMWELRLAAIAAQRRRLDELSRTGTFGSTTLRQRRAQLDADELSLRLRLDDV